ncbi:porin [Mannheimia sp. HC-2023]|uniref:porin n=1 Tax=Mannheimia indoligenes TaxID=3103145 RepID=UPI002FE6585B
MKKTLVALALTAFAASASATVVYDADGTKVDFWGSLRLIVDNQTKKEGGKKVAKEDNGDTKLRNGGTRFGVKVNHALNDNGFYALGALQVRLKGNQDAGFGDLYAHQAYVGLGQKEYGQLTFGKQPVIADDVGLANDYAYGLLDDYVPTSSTSAIRYDYNGIEGLTLSANYNFSQTEENNGKKLVTVDPVTGEKEGYNIKNGYGLGAIYEVNNWIFQGAYGRTNYKTDSADKIRANAFDAAIGYNINDAVLVGVDGGYRVTKDGSEKEKEFYVGPMVKVQVTDKSSIYGNYKYAQTKYEGGSKDKEHGFLVGTDYKFHKNVVAFVEGAYVKGRSYDSQGNHSSAKTTEQAIGVGLRVNW